MRPAVLTMAAVLHLACGTDAGQLPEPVAGWGRARVEEELRIGVDEGPVEYMMGKVTDVAVGGDGSIFVAEVLPALLRMYDAEGNFVRQVGATGQGPGEYGQIMGIEMLPDGRLVLWDIDNQRLNYYDAAGEFVGAVAAEAGLHASRVLNVDSHGNVLLTAMDRGDPARSSTSRRVLMRISPDGQVLEMLKLPDEEPQEGGFVFASAEGFLPNFTISTRNAWSPLGYVVSGRNDNYVLHLIEGGEVTGEIHGSYEPVPIVGEEREQWEAWTRYNEGRSAPTGFVNAPPMKFHEVPEYKPAFKEIYVGSDGLIWVQRYVEAARREAGSEAEGDRPPFRWREPPVFDVFEPGGRLLGSVALPPGTYVHARRGKVLWASQADDQDVIRVLRLRVATGS